MEKKLWVKTELYLGEAIPGGFEISDRQFAGFLDAVVTKHFPKGFTVYKAEGQMQEPDKTITRQATRVIVLIHEKTPAKNRAIETIIREYRRRFQNAEVMRTTAPMEVEFHTHE